MYLSALGIEIIYLAFGILSLLIIPSEGRGRVLKSRREVDILASAPYNNNQQLGACQGNNLNLSCYHGFTIHIISAIVQEAPPNNCGLGTVTNYSYQCSSSKVKQLVQESCENENKCSVNQTVYNYCTHFGNYLFVEFVCSLYGIGIITEGYPTSPAITTQGYPKSVGSCSATHRRNIYWPTTLAGSWSLGKCPNQPSSMAVKWKCGNNPVAWIDEPDFGNCKSEVIDGLRRNIVSLKGMSNTTALLHVASSMAVETARLPVIGQDLNTMTFVMNELVSQVNSEMNKPNGSETVKSVIKDISSAILQTSSNLLNVTWIDLPVADRDKTGTLLMGAVESSAFQLSSTLSVGQTVTNETSHIVSEVRVIQTSRGSNSSVTFPRPESTRDSSWLLNSISLTADTLSNLTKDGTGQARLVFSVYKNLGDWLVPSAESTDSLSSNISSDCGNSTNCMFVNSLVISASVNSRSADNVPLASPVTFTLQHNVIENVGLAKCVSWTYSDILETGDWSSAGCWVVTTNNNYTTCACSHLTSFAIIMSPTQPNISKSNELALTAITYIGFSISILCYILCFVTFLIFKSLQCDRNTIHKNLVLCLLIANVIFLAGIDLYNTPILCSVIAAFLHYFFLASFAWMCLEGVQLYVMLIQVFEAEKSPVLWYYLSAYGAPALVVGVSAAVYHQGYGTTSHCWLTTDRGFIWSFLGPVCAIICVNFVMLGIAIRAMMNHAKTVAARKSKEQGSLEQIRLWLKGTVILIFLLGLTWVFGLLFINANSIVFAYIFTILNSFQGLFIFIFHCLMSEKVRKEYKKCIRGCACLPESFKSRFGETKTTSSTASAPDRSSNKGRGKRHSGHLLGEKSTKNTQETSLSALKHSEDSQNESCDESQPMREKRNSVFETNTPKSTAEHRQNETDNDEPNLKYNGVELREIQNKNGNEKHKTKSIPEPNKKCEAGCLPPDLYVEVLQQWQKANRTSEPSESRSFDKLSENGLHPNEKSSTGTGKVKLSATLSI